MVAVLGSMAPKKISLACGNRKPYGFFGVDLADLPGVDLVCDLLEFPWPIANDSVAEISCEHFVEHIPHWRPGWKKDGFFLFFDEVYRICRHGAICTFVHPYVMNGRAFQDPTHERFINEGTWRYLDRDWRDEQKLDHYADVDFRVLGIMGAWVDDAYKERGEKDPEWMERHWNLIADLHVRLGVRKNDRASS